MHNQHGIELISNVCKHHQALILQNKGTLKSIICPFHRWQYALDGHLKKAPHFAQTPCVQLDKTALYTLNKLLFEHQKPNIASPDSLLNSLVFDGYAYSNSVTLQAPYNWKIFIDNYLDDYHIQPLHSGLKTLVNIHDLTWEFSKSHVVQRIGIQQTSSQHASVAFQKWHAFIHQIQAESMLPMSSSIIWILIYPTTMIEVYPYMMTLSTLKPVSVDVTMNHVDFFYPEAILSQFPDYATVSQAAYREIAEEDDRLCMSIHAGRKTLFEQKKEDLGFFHHTLETGIRHFHTYWYAEMDKILT
ncbi:MAG: hypothetical protein B7X00_01870 [Legionella sp. 21-45-4]|nr:MAG: hypothetical protein B7X00_01870 [Legionella sp. 21-45-4]